VAVLQLEQEANRQAGFPHIVGPMTRCW
jgi:hypothetical protein